MTEIDSDDGNPNIDKLLAELENDGVPEESNKSKKDKTELKYDDPMDDETERNEDNTW